MRVSTHTGSQICDMHAPKSKAGGGSTTRNDQKKDLADSHLQPMPNSDTHRGLSIIPLRNPGGRRDQKREVVHVLTHAHACPLSRSCLCLGLSRAAWYTPPQEWTVRDAALITALSHTWWMRIRAGGFGRAVRGCASSIHTGITSGSIECTTR